MKIDLILLRDYYKLEQMNVNCKLKPLEEVFFILKIGLLT